MQITVIGCGYVGLTNALGLCKIGHNVIAADRIHDCIDRLNQGEMPFYEPKLSELLKECLEKKLIVFSKNPAEAISKSMIVISAVGTPSTMDGSVDLSDVFTVAELFAINARSSTVLINKSTVPVGTLQKIEKIIQKKSKKSIQFKIIANPEFLREGSALNDFMKPDRIVIGADCELSQVQPIIEELYAPIIANKVRVFWTNLRTAEMIKYTANAFLATKISFINNIAELCEKIDVDITKVAAAIGMDKRIGSSYLNAGLGYGGSCLPKDIKGLIKIGETEGVEMKIVKCADEINLVQAGRIVDKINHELGVLTGKKITVLGLSYKPDTDDIRDSRALRLIELLLQYGVIITVFDPVAMPVAKKQLGKRVIYANDYYSALQHAHAVLIATEWPEFKNPDYSKMRTQMAGNYIFDGRNITNLMDAKKYGFKVYGVGRMI